MKRGSVLLIVGIVVGILLLASVSAGVYFYKFYVFEDVEICLTNEYQNLFINCSSKQECRDYLESSSEFTQAQERLDEMPEFISSRFDEAIDKAVFCNNTCQIRKIRGMDNNQIGQVACQEYDEVLRVEITGERLLEMLRYAEENNLTNY
ncbi:MAG: hypothetical protein ACP5D2_02350 [Candidatus Nanoarchaeia archaeon]